MLELDNLGLPWSRGLFVIKEFSLVSICNDIIYVTICLYWYWRVLAEVSCLCSVPVLMMRNNWCALLLRVSSFNENIVIY